MRKLMELLQVAIGFIEPYPCWVKSIVGIWVLLTAIMIEALLFTRSNRSLDDSVGGKPGMKKPKGDIHQTAIGDNNLQVGTTGNNSPILFDNRTGLVPRQIARGTSFQSLLPFAGTKVYLHWRSDDNESVTFKNNLSQYLNASQWKVTASMGHVADDSFHNVVLDLNANLTDKDKAVLAANALKNILDAQRIESTIHRRPDNHLSNDEMYIRIGSLHQGDPKLRTKPETNQ